MKKTLLTFLATFLLCGMVAAQDVSKVLGTYVTDLYINIGAPISENSEPVPGVKVQLTPGTMPGTVNFELRDFEMGEGMMLGDIVLPNIPLIDNGDGNYGFGENAPVSLTLMEVINAQANLNTETSYVRGDELMANVDVVWLTGDEETPEVPIYVRAAGTKEQVADVSKVLGDYVTDLYINIGAPISEDSEPVPGVKVQLIQGTMPGTVNFELRDFEMGEGMMLGDIVLPNIPLIDNGEGNYGFGKNAPVSLTLMEVINAQANLNTETSYVRGNELMANVDVIWLTGDEEMPEVPIYVRAAGTRLIPEGIGNSVGIDAGAKASGVYSLSGVRVADSLSGSLPKGIYIVNGKKIIR